MEKKPFTSKKPKGGKNGRRGIRNAAFAILLILFAMALIGAYGHQKGLTEIDESQAIQDANRGQYSKIEKKGNELLITEKGQSVPTLKSYVDPNGTLKQEGFNTTKFKEKNDPVTSSGSFWGQLLASFLPIAVIAGLLYFMLKSAQGQGNQAMSFGKSKARLYGNEKR